MAQIDNSISRIQDEVNKLLVKEPQLIPHDQMKTDEVISFPMMEKEIEKMVTDPKLFEDIRKDWQEVLRICEVSSAFDKFKEKYEAVYTALEESYSQEQKQMKRCKEMAAELIKETGATQANQKFANESADSIGMYKDRIKIDLSQVISARAKEEELRKKIFDLREDIGEMNNQLQRRIGDIQHENMKTIAELTRQKEEQAQVNEKLHSKVLDIKNKSGYAAKEKSTQEEENYKNITEISNLKEQIANLKFEIAKEETRKNNKDEEMNNTKKKIDEAVEDRDKKIDSIKENEKKIEQEKDKVLAKSKEKEKLHENVHIKTSQKNGAEKEKEKQDSRLENLQRTLKEQEEQKDQKGSEIQDLEYEETKLFKDHHIIEQKRNQKFEKRKELEKIKLDYERIIETDSYSLDERKKALSVVEGDIDSVVRQKEEINRDIKKGEDEEHHIDDELAELQNTLKKLENHIRGLQIEGYRITKNISMLEKEQEKYGIDASQAHARYYQTLEELKIKNNLITELQNKNKELDAKLKHQQNLYEAVRSDRNLYSKNLLQAEAEISELTKKFTRMSHQVDQLKDELKVKDANLVKKDREVQKIVKENEKTRIDKTRLDQNIKNIDTLIKNQEDQISRLKHTITEAQNEKQRQQKDYEMVVNERDILGSQLIKRNQELSVLYEKIKIAQSNLAKGESYFRDKQKEFTGAQESLMLLRKELENTKEQTECVDDLKQEISSLQKDLLNQKAKVKALRDELDIRMNVHRWRKIEAVDPENYERILKIQTLQRRLIAKTEEATEKDQLIKEKEKLYMELKNILARQPGPEIQQELATYKENLKEKTGQMKKMLGELKEAQNQVHMHKFDIDRVKGELGRLKQEYFKRRNAEDKAESNSYQINIGQNMAIPMAYRMAQMNQMGQQGAGANFLIGGSGAHANPQQA